VSLSGRADDLLALRHRLPDLVGQAWERIGDEVEGLLDELERAASDDERQRLYDLIMDRLYLFADVRSELARHESRRGGGGQQQQQQQHYEPSRQKPHNGGGVTRSAPPPPPARSAPPQPYVRGPKLVYADGEPIEASGGGGAPEIPSEVIERTPHLDVDAQQPIAVGRRFTVRVWLDTQAPRPGEQATNPIVLPALSELQLRVWLAVSDHFEILGEDVATITVQGAEPRSTEATFELECRQALPSEAGISATFAYGIRPAGSVMRIVEVEGVAPGRPRELPEPAARVDAGAHQPDLVVQVLENPDDDEGHYEITIASPRLAAYAAGVKVPWRLGSATKTLVEGYFDAFTTSDRGGRRAALVGAGRALFSATPKAFQEAVWQLAELADPPVKSILVVSAEPYIPWELMIPNEGQRSLRALGVEFSVGRWVDQQQTSPEQAAPFVDSAVIAPTYRGSKVLGFSAAEAQYVIDAFNGTRIDPALLLRIDEVLGQHGPTLLHFICHGVNKPGGQVLDLDPDETLREIQLGGLDGVRRAVADAKPFVFINACEVGRATPGLVGTGGFASQFINLGARCVLAPIWSVKDDVAGTVAREFYDAVRADPSRPFAGVLRDIRARAYEGADPEDSYAAYCFYGDPLAAQAP
jgi:hypothetical protein